MTAPQNSSIVVWNIQGIVNIDDISEIFSAYGPIANIRKRLDYYEITFNDARDADDAIHANENINENCFLVSWLGNKGESGRFRQIQKKNADLANVDEFSLKSDRYGLTSNKKNKKVWVVSRSDCEFANRTKIMGVYNSKKKAIYKIITTLRKAGCSDETISRLIYHSDEVKYKYYVYDYVACNVD